MISGFCSTSKKSLLFSLPFFMPLPVFTLAAWTSMSKAAVVTSGLFIVRVAFHWSNLPTMETEDFTLNVTELETGVTSKTGTCAQPNGVSKAVGYEAEHNFSHGGSLAVGDCGVNW